MILTDTGPLVALFGPADHDHDHGRCAAILSRIEEPLCSKAGRGIRPVRNVFSEPVGSHQRSATE